MDVTYFPHTLLSLTGVLELLHAVVRNPVYLLQKDEIAIVEYVRSKGPRALIAAVLQVASGRRQRDMYVTEAKRPATDSYLPSA